MDKIFSPPSPNPAFVRIERAESFRLQIELSSRPALAGGAAQANRGRGELEGKHGIR